jgi:hypothetical protein
MRNALSAATRHKLTLLQTKALMALETFADAEGRCRPSMRTLASLCWPGWHEGQAAPTRLYDAISALESADLVRVVRRSGGGRSNTYEVRTSADARGVRRGGVHGARREGVHGVRQEGVHRVRPNTHTNIQEDTHDGVRGLASLGSEESGPIVEAFRALGIRSKDLIQRALKRQGVAWMREVYAVARAGDVPAALAVTFLKNPSRFRSPDGDRDGDARTLEDAFPGYADVMRRELRRRKQGRGLPEAEAEFAESDIDRVILDAKDRAAREAAEAERREDQAEPERDLD